MPSYIQLWKSQIKWFIEKHPFFADTNEKIYTPKKGLFIRFWIEGNLQIEGKYEQIHINYNSQKLLVLSTTRDSKESIFRVPWNRIISIELIPEKDAPNSIKKLLNIAPEQKN